MPPNPWFRVWPKYGGAPSQVAAPPVTPSKSVAQFMASTRIPSKFVEVIPFEIAVAAGLSVQGFVKFGADYPFRMDAVVLQYLAAGVPVAYPDESAEVTLSTPGGRKLTREPVNPSALNTDQGGRDWIPYRWRFAPNDLLQIEVRNLTGSDLVARGFVYGYNLTMEARR